MQNILILDHDTEILNILSPYFVDSIKFYHKHYNVTYLGMILHKDNNYFTIGLKESYKGYTEYTPLILFKRDPEVKSFLYEDDHSVPYDSKSRKQNALWEQANIDVQLSNPWVLHKLFFQFRSKVTSLKHSVLLPPKAIFGKYVEVSSFLNFSSSSQMFFAVSLISKINSKSYGILPV